jgi:thiol-disulfide isomerase/thioredoxin
MDTSSSSSSDVNPTLLTSLPSVQAFSDLLQSKNPGLVILKFGAEWCGPCKRIEPLVHGWYDKIQKDVFFSSRVVCGVIDVDENFEVYGFLKSKRRINGIPAILCYHKGNVSYIPDDMMAGADVDQVNALFERNLMALKQRVSG